MNILVVLPFGLEGAAGRKREALSSFLNVQAIVGASVTVLSVMPAREKWPAVRWLECGDAPAKIPGLAACVLRKIIPNRYRYEWLGELCRAHRKRPFDLIVAHFVSGIEVLPVLILQNYLMVKTIVYEHRTSYQRNAASRNRGTSRILRHVIARTSTIVALSQPHAAAISFVLGRNDVEYIPLSVSDSFFEVPKVPSNRIPPIQMGQIRIAAWTNWREIKRLDRLVGAFALAAARWDSIELTVAGPLNCEPHKDEVMALLRARGLNQRVRFLGELTRDEVRNLAHSSDVCLISSDHETLALPALEALALGRPVVTTRCGGPESLLLSPDDGEVALENCTEGLAAALSRLLNRISVIDRDAIRRRAVAHFSEQAVARRWIAVYKGAIG